MKKFMDKDFLLDTPTARKLFNDYAEKLPIIDYHCHIDPQEIYEDKHYDNITQVWLYGDHYKWRAIRSNGVPEKYITGDSSDYEKFEKWAETMPKLIGNPLYHWTHLELKKYFGYNGSLNAETADEVWDITKRILTTLSVREIIKSSNVEVICTTDDPTSDLKYHKLIAEDDTFNVAVLPAFRPDKAMNIDKVEFADYIDKLSEASGIKISSFGELKEALKGRVEFFDTMGCRACDHGLDYAMYNMVSDSEADRILKERLNGGKLSETEVDGFKTALLMFLAEQYTNHGWVMELHYSCIRNNNTKMYESIGPDTGFDAIYTRDSSQGLADLLDALDRNGSLPKTIIFSLNPNDNAMIGSVIGCFQSEEAKTKVQQGSAWWFNDTKEGMISQLKTFASLSVLGNFAGMLTDSRSFLSYTRHEYFRRILCNLIGGWVENGEYPDDEPQLAELIEGISYKNAKTYFGF
jgi:glucuronate isomerase